MKVTIDSIFKQIVNINGSNPGIKMLKDVKLDLKKEYEYDISESYENAYYYLCDCLLIGNGNNSQKLLDLYLIHQYLCYYYLSEDAINHWPKEHNSWTETKIIIIECFCINRIIGAFQECIKQYEILRGSKLWQIFTDVEQIQIMKETAKAYRNTGDFKLALKLYYDCLIMNTNQNWLLRVELLIKIGKVYRNYLMQTELARFYVEEAYLILKANEEQTINDDKVRRYAIICSDTLGQIYRDKQDYKNAEIFFKESESLHEKSGSRAYIHETLMKYKEKSINNDMDLERDIAFLKGVIMDLEKLPIDQIGVGVRSVQLGRLKFSNLLKKEAYEDVYHGRSIAYKYNDIKTVIRSYMEEADFLKKERKYTDYISVSKIAIKLASDNNQLVLENEVIKGIIELSISMPDIIDSATKIDLIRHRKDIYMKLIEFSKYSIDIVRNGFSFFISQDKLIDVYGIVLNDFEQILGELNTIIEILNIEINEINQKYIAYLNTEIRGFTYKNILHKFKNDLPNEDTISQLQTLCEGIQTYHSVDKETLLEVNKQLEAFANIIAHIKQSANDTLKESEHEKNWCSLNILIQKGIQNFIYCRPEYKNIISYKCTEQNIEILVQSILFEVTISEILNNAFGYAETTLQEEIKEHFKFLICPKIMENKTVVLECYSRYSNEKLSNKAKDSIEEGLKYKHSAKKEGSRYGFYSMKFLFEDLMGGKIQVLQRKNNVGIIVCLPINLVTLRIE